ncbi:response regulator transcription factor [Abyssalbus ytuae]|uniref:Response regulator transcription factor n=1 Tax=Abyssalbus ytuae TaxID=2926907 RepID=A0A9E6ZPE3_9FLAO|nr:response regulator transcription factor [Abyssalbus ytuae]UOB18080.1 response regulator transcription factor [Abyssalbus ytuae]
MKVVLADDHVLVRDGIKSLLEDEKDILVIDEASDGAEALKVVKKNKPDVLIIDIRMPELNGIEVVKKLKESGENIKTLVLSMHDSEEYVVQSIQAGADGYLLKGASKEEFLKALNSVAEGGKYFSGDISAIIFDHFVKGETTKLPQKVIPNEFALTKREQQILHYVLEGKSNKEIAEELKISKRTAEVHRFNLMKKLKVKNLMELANVAKQHNLN